MRWLVLLVSLTACKASISDGMDGSVVGDIGEGSGSDATIQLGPWGPPTALDFAAVGDDDPTATGDMLELYFNRAADIYVTRRSAIGSPWQTPEPVAELNTAEAETTPEVSYDGLTIYFASARAGTLGGNDVWRSTRISRGAAWSSPVHVNELCSTAPDGAPTVVDPLIATLDSARAGASLDIFIATRSSATTAFDTPVVIAELNSAQDEGNPMLTPDKLSVYFDSNRSGNGELYVATRATSSGPFGTPERIVELSSTNADTDPWLSPDGRTMYFTSNRDGTLRLWQTTR
ncbi:MAG TPA: hypothetical protein VIV11_18805 [Kofleriaceae bacterium]